MTTRSKRYGHKGDTFEIFDAEFELVEEPRLEPLEMILKHWADEGCESREDLEQVWCTLHPIKKLEDLSEKFWVHEFERVER